jgi:hypothetical protein
MTVKIIGNRIIKDSGPPAYSDMTPHNGLLSTFTNDFRGWVWQDNAENKVYEWNYATGNSGSWDFLYNLGETGGGLAKLSGANFVGSVTAPSIAPINNPAFSGNVTVSNQQVATQTYVISQVDSLASTISQLVNQAIASAGSSAGTSTNIAKKSGYYDPIAATSSTIPTHKEIPFPSYVSGTQNTPAKASECIWVASAGSSGSTISSATPSTQTQTIFCQQVSPRIYRSYVDLYTASSSSHMYIPLGLNWLIIGVRYSNQSA